MKTFITLFILGIIILAGGLYYASYKSASRLGLLGATSYMCDQGKTINASFYKGKEDVTVDPSGGIAPNGSVTVVLSDGRTFSLKQTLSASGVRYTNEDESFVFWTKGNGALVLENNQEKSYIGCIEVADDTEDSQLPQTYQSSQEGFSIRLPAGFSPNTKYTYTAMGQSKAISGVQFLISSSTFSGTNLSSDSYISVEQIPNATDCNAKLFLGGAFSASTVKELDTTYSYASSTDAGAGNRYEEVVYALPGTNPCVAVRYFIHYGVLENYPEGSVIAFDKNGLIKQFDAIRKTLVINQ